MPLLKENIWGKIELFHDWEQFPWIESEDIELIVYKIETWLLAPNSYQWFNNCILDNFLPLFERFEHNIVHLMWCVEFYLSLKLPSCNLRMFYQNNQATKTNEAKKVKDFWLLLWNLNDLKNGTRWTQTCEMALKRQFTL